MPPEPLSAFDTHVHLDCPPLAAQLEYELAAARRAGVGNWLVPGVRPGDGPRVLALTARHAGVLAAPGCHPLAADDWDAAARQQLAACLDHPAVVAVGEIGLDALLPASPERQEAAFRDQLQLAAAACLPVLLHCRRRQGRLLAILREERFPCGGILHGYSGSVETARQALDLGFVIGFGGVLTWPGAIRPEAVLRALPAEAIVLETDAPDQAPHPHRGEVNRPAWLPLVADRVAAIRGWDRAQTWRITTTNARRVLQLPLTDPQGQTS